MSERIVHQFPRADYTMARIVRIDRPLTDDPHGRPYQLRNGLIGGRSMTLAHMTRRELEALADALNDELART